MSLIHFTNKYYLDIDIECTDGRMHLFRYLNFLKMKLTSINLNVPCMHAEKSVLYYYYYVSIRKYFTFTKKLWNLLIFHNIYLPIIPSRFPYFYNGNFELFLYKRGFYPRKFKIDRYFKCINHKKLANLNDPIIII